jgi:hypothetical protein
MTTTFEQQAQLKSAGITLGIVVALFLLLYFIPYSISKMVQPEEEMGMLVNLGNSED